MVGRVDMAIAIRTTLKIITDQLELPTIPTIICTNLYSLYECLVKLGTTKEKLDLKTPLLFNGCILSLNKDFIALRQKGQSKKIDIVNINSLKQGYIEQHIYRAYVASICQPKASFDLSVATQH